MKSTLPKLSILICSLHARAKYLNRLRERLKPQITDDVEVLVSIDNGEMAIGAKRNLLLNKAQGEYIAFIDDDDLVYNDYVEKILKAIETKPDVVGMHLIMTVDDLYSEQSYHSLKYKTWYDESDPDNPGRKRYFRNPNHLNPVKRELALKAGFPSINMCEDRHYSANLLPHLKTEVYIEDPIYLYLVRTRKEC